MEVADAIKKRRSIRRYAEKPVEDDKIQQIMEAARLAPSWHNGQCWRFIVVRDKKTIDALAENSWDFVKDAPAVLVACGVPEESGDRDGKKYYLVDVAIAVAHASLMMTSLGLGGCWVGVFNEKNVKKILGIPDEIEVAALFPFGYPLAEKGPVENRKPMAEIVLREKWS